jgi:ligand-binding SRPBCC domain-containing protein
MRVYTIRRTQWISRSVDEVFAFFSDARNLEALTPAWLGFRILTPGPIHLAEGTRIRYRLRLHGIPVGWETEIRKWRAPHVFVDVQLHGPYRLWHHTHRFEAKGGGTVMTDIVRYQLSFGIIGRIAHRLIVRRDVERIFDYRFERIQNIFRATAVEAK